MTDKQKISSETEFLIPELCKDQQLFLLIMASQLLVIMFMLFQYGLQFDWTHFGLVTLYVYWQVLVSAVLLCKMRQFLGRLSMNRAAVVAYAVLLMVGFLTSVVAQWFYNQITLVDISWQFVLRNVLLSAIIIGLALRYFYIQQQLISREKAQLQASLWALQARIKPHFLFNTLNNIASLITIEPDKAERMVENVSTLLRASLREDVVEVSIEDEWELCQNYLQIEQIRIGERLSWTCDFSELDQSLKIPSLSLQPIVENAVYYGIQSNPESGYIRIGGVSNDEFVRITIENSQSKVHQAGFTSKGNHMAIENIRHRIKQLYGETAELELNNCESYFLVTLSYNLKERTL